MVPGGPVIQGVEAEREVLIEVNSILLFHDRIMIRLNKIKIIQNKIKPLKKITLKIVKNTC